MSSKMTKTETKKTKKTIITSDDEDTQPITKQPAKKVSQKETSKVTSKVPPKETKPIVKDVTNKDSDDESDSDDSDDDANLVQDDDSDEDSEQEADDSADESVDDSADDKPKEKEKEKKAKESFEEIVKRLEELVAKKKVVHKKIVDNEAEHKSLQREDNEILRELSKLSPLLTKAHTDKIARVHKEKKSNRKGNVNGGFNALKPVPEVFRKYLELPDDAQLKLPQLMSRFNNKLSTTGQKDGQTAILTVKTLKTLGLSDTEPRSVKFTEMMHFLAGFYPKKEIKVEVEV